MESIIYASNKALYLTLLLSAIPVGVATAVGLIVGLLQTVTQIQEQTLPFGVKLIAVFVCIYILSGWFGGHLLNYAKELAQIALSRR